MNINKIYKLIAKRYDVSVSEVKRDLTEAMHASNIRTENLDEFMTIVLSKASEIKNTIN